MCNISVCQDTEVEDYKLAWNWGSLPSLYECPMTVMRADAALVAGT